MQVADIFTKSLISSQFCILKSKLGMKNIYFQVWDELLKYLFMLFCFK